MRGMRVRRAASSIPPPLSAKGGPTAGGLADEMLLRTGIDAPSPAAPMKLLPLTLSTAALLLVAAACSTPQADTRKVAGGAVSRFHALDKNGDGKVTFAEFNDGFADLVLSTYDRTHDGTVSQQEWDAIERANTNNAQSSFRLLDSNHDGRLTRDELSHGKRRDAVVRR